MRQQAVQNDQRSLSHLEGPELLLRPGRRVENIKTHAAFRRAHPTRFQSELVAARNRPQTSVFNRRVFKCKPQSRDLCRFSVEKRAVLMTSNLAADIRLFEDVHRL